MTTRPTLTCREAEPLIPLFAGGGLAESEGDPLREHLDRCSDCRKILAESVELIAAAGRHLPADWLVDLADGLPLEAADAELARRHLEDCAPCRELLAMARTDRRETAGGRRPRSRSVLSRRDWLAVAALLVLSLGWLGSWIHLREIRSGITQHGGALLNPVLVELPPVSAERGDGGPQEVQLDGESPYLVLVLISEASPPSDSSARLEIRAPDGTVLHSQDDLRRDGAGLYTVLLPTAGLAPGIHRAEVSGTAGRLEIFELEILPPAPPDAADSGEASPFRD